MSGAFDLRSTALPKGTVLLEASAGTGKTYTITGVVLRLLLEGLAADLSRILVVTFTVAATEELKNRLRRALTDAAAACAGAATDDPFLRHLAATHGRAGADTLLRALAMADEMSVATIHGFCRRVLDEAAFESGQPFVTEFVDDELPLCAEAARDAVRLEILPRDPLTAAVAADQDLRPDDLMPQWRAYRRHPGTVLRPAVDDLDAVIRELHAAHAAVRAMVLDGKVADAGLAQLPRKKSRKKGAGREPQPGLAPGREPLVELNERLGNPDDHALELLLGFALDHLDKILMKDGWRRSHPFFAACDRLRIAVATTAHGLRQRLFARMDERLALQKARTHTLTFADLLGRVDATLRDDRLGAPLRKAIRERWQVAIIDEFQDTDPLQYSVFATCFADQRLLLVGDPKQSIYGFRGADVAAYLLARQDARARHTLDANHRSHPQLVHAVRTLFAGRAAFATAGIELPSVRAALAAADLDLVGDDVPALQIRWLPPGSKPNKARNAMLATTHNREFAEERVVVDVADECVRLLGGGVLAATGAGRPPRPLRAADLAVLTRTNVQAVAMQDELRRRGVHSAIGKAGDVYACPEMDDMQRLLQALANPGYLPLLRAAWTTPLFGFDQAMLQALDDDQDALGQWLARADTWRRTWVRHGFVVMFQDLLYELDARARLLLRPDGERKLTNYLQIAELLHHAEMARQLAPESLLQWLAHERRHADEIDYELRELRLESDADAVQILTVHGSKGLQYDVVFVPFAWGSRDPAPTGQPLLVGTADGGHLYTFDGAEIDRHSDAAGRAQLAEDLRLLYVALTRARRRCYVHWTPANTADGAALTWLVAGPGRSDTPAADLPSYEAARTALHGSYREAWRAAAAALAAGSNGAIGVVDLTVDPPPGPPPRLQSPAGPRLARPRPLPERVSPGFRIASFTSMLAHDRSSEPLREQDEPEHAATVAPAAPASGLYAFARGAAAGVCLHEILEHLDFAAATHPRARELVQRTLRHHGLADAAAHRAPIDPVAVVTATAAALADARLGDLPFRLADLAPLARCTEWQFFVAAGRTRPRDLAPVFRAHAAPALRDYADRLATLPAFPMQGFLRGFVDLVAEHDGRYHVFDWKSNWLGDHADDYGEAALRRDLQQNHYVLQYHLYLLALHRHLRARLPDYDCDRHLGSACYVYLRAIDTAERGVVVDRPSRAMIEALDHWLAGEERR